jgi:transcriptional regulator with XRE-family HTH domain
MAKETQATLGTYLRAKREAAGLTLRELEQLTGISNGYLAKLENDQKDNPSAEKLQRLAEVLEVDASELLAFIGVEPSSSLPPARIYFRRKYGMDSTDAEALARLVEEYTSKDT